MSRRPAYTQVAYSGARPVSLQCSLSPFAAAARALLSLAQRARRTAPRTGARARCVPWDVRPAASACLLAITAAARALGGTQRRPVALCARACRLLCTAFPAFQLSLTRLAAAARALAERSVAPCHSCAHKHAACCVGCALRRRGCSLSYTSQPRLAPWLSAASCRATPCTRFRGTHWVHEWRADGTRARLCVAPTPRIHASPNAHALSLVGGCSYSMAA